MMKDNDIIVYTSECLFTAVKTVRRLFFRISQLEGVLKAHNIPIPPPILEEDEDIE